MGLSSATQRKPMISVQNLCDTSRFRTLRTMWLMPRGGRACGGGTCAASLAMVPSLIGNFRSTACLPGQHEHCTVAGTELHPAGGRSRGPGGPSDGNALSVQSLGAPLPQLVQHPVLIAWCRDVVAHRDVERALRDAGQEADPGSRVGREPGDLPGRALDL